MGKGSKQTQTVDQTQNASSTFNNQQFMDQLAQFQQMQQGATGLDAGSQAYVDQMRQHALGGIGSIGAGNFAPSMDQINQLTGQMQNPYQEQVLGGLGQQFDKLRGQAGVATNQDATAAGAFGGSRHGVAQGQRMGELDQAQMQQAGQLMSQNFQGAQQNAMGLAQLQGMAPIQALMAQQGLMQGGLGPTGQVQSGVQSGTQAGQQFGTQSGWQDAQSNMRSNQVNRQSGDLFGDLLGLGQMLSGFIPG